MKKGDKMQGYRQSGVKGVQRVVIKDRKTGEPRWERWRAKADGGRDLYYGDSFEEAMRVRKEWEEVGCWEEEWDGKEYKVKGDEWKVENGWNWKRIDEVIHKEWNGGRDESLCSVGG